MLPCVNCKREVPPDDGKLFARTFVCPNCFLIATRIRERAQRELKQLLLVLDEAIRVELLEGRLQFSTMEQVEEVSKKDLFSHLQDAAQRARRGEQPVMPPKEAPWQTRVESSKSPAITAGDSTPPDSR